MTYYVQCRTLLINAASGCVRKHTVVSHGNWNKPTTPLLHSLHCYEIQRRSVLSTGLWKYQEHRHARSRSGCDRLSIVSSVEFSTLLSYTFTSAVLYNAAEVILPPLDDGLGCGLCKQLVKLVLETLRHRYFFSTNRCLPPLPSTHYQIPISPCQPLHDSSPSPHAAADGTPRTIYPFSESSANWSNIMLRGDDHPVLPPHALPRKRSWWRC